MNILLRLFFLLSIAQCIVMLEAKKKSKHHKSLSSPTSAPSGKNSTGSTGALAGSDSGSSDEGLGTTNFIGSRSENSGGATGSSSGSFDSSAPTSGSTGSFLQSNSMESGSFVKNALIDSPTSVINKNESQAPAQAIRYNSTGLTSVARGGKVEPIEKPKAPSPPVYNSGWKVKEINLNNASRHVLKKLNK